MYWAKRNLAEHPDWNDIKAADVLLKEVRDGKHPNLHIIAEPIKPDLIDVVIPMERGFMECRDCGKVIGVSIAPAGTDMDFECIDCYNQSVEDGI